MKCKIYYLIVLLVTSLTSMSQRTVTGRVTREASTEALPGVTVSVKGGRTSTATNADGNFSITVPNNNAVLVFTSVGYKRKEVPVGSSTNLTVAIAEEASTLNDVVVVGYQSMRRRELLASVSSVSAKDLKDVPINSAAEALNGRLAGVTATTAEGSPDANIRIRVRGGMSITQNNDPLFIIDGVQVENGLSTISPQDIQTIDVLKDAAATAIYGARGANGVIVITTKAGRVGRTIISYNGFAGVRILAKKLGVLSPYDYIVYLSERSRGSSTDSLLFLRNFGGYTRFDTLEVYKNYEAVDWQEEVFGRTGVTTTHNLTANGGNKRVTFNVGYTFNNDKAIVINSRYQRHLANAKVDYKLTNKVKLGAGVRFTRQDVYGAGVSSEQGSSYNRLRNAVKYRPFLFQGQEITDQDPLADPNVGNGLILVNPIELANAEYRRRSTEAYNGTVNLSYNIIKNLSFKSIFGYDRNKITDRQFYDSIAPYSIISAGRTPIAGLDTVTRTTLTNSNVLTYSVKRWKNKHDIDILIGEETYDLRSQVQSSLYRNFPLFISSGDAFKQTNLGTSFAGYPRLSKTRYTNLSFFNRLKYSLLSRYLFEFNIRADGASKFAPGEQWGFFPAGSIGWNVKNEAFMEDESVKFISDLKFRAGIGIVGNNRIPDYLFYPTFSNNGQYFYGINGQSVTAYYSAGLVNPILKWESTVNRNIGVDAGFFDNRLSFSLDLYSNSSKDLLLNVPIPGTFGYTTQLQNIGKTSNKGIDLQLNATLLKARNNLNWTANFNISHNENKIVALGRNQESFQSTGYSGVSGQPTDYIQLIGQPVGSMYGLVVDGFYKVEDFNYNTATGRYTLKSGVVNDSIVIGGPAQPGSIKYRDLNGDGLVDLTNDRTIIGNPTPKFTGGLNQQFTYKQWDASIFVNFSVGNDVYNANKVEFSNGYTANSNLLDIMQNRWRTITPTGQTAQYATSSAVFGIPPDQLAALNANATMWQPLRGTGAFYLNSWAVEDGSFLRLNNVTIGYSLPVRNLAALHMSKLRFYVTGNNLAILTRYTGYDPEVSVRNNPLTPGLDYSAYPKSRSFIFGINASF